MRLIHRANACFSLFRNNKHILFDPWLNGPAVAQGWTPYPPAKSKIEDLPKPDLVYISHIHSDHCEDETLNGIDKDTPIIIMDLNPNFLNKMLIKKDFKNITLLKDKEKTKINAIDDLYAEPFPATFGHICANIIDSGIILELDGKVILNCNDNKPSEELCHYLKEKYGQIDVALIPGAGGSSYPAMYENISPDEKAEILRKNLKNYAAIFSKAVDILKPEVVVPVAGGFAVRGPDAATVNWFQTRPFDHNDLINYHKEHGVNFESQIIPMQPELELDVDAKKLTNGEYRPWSKEELQSFFEEIAKIPITTKVRTYGKVPALANLLKTARHNLWEKQNKNEMKPNYYLYLENSDTDEIFELPIHENRIAKIEKSTEKKKPFLRMKMTQDTLMEWLLGYEDFNMLDSGHRISFIREPNEYLVEPYFLMSLFRV